MNNRTLKIFFSGIAGSGVSAIANFMAERGHIIVGSDRAFDIGMLQPLKDVFLSKGIKIVPQDGKGIDRSFDFAIFSTAIEPDRPEVLKAREYGIPVKTRPDCLAEITSSFSTIAISGTSGKSTTAGLLAFLMEGLGLCPNFIGGGRVKQFKSSSNPGNSLSGNSAYLVVEVCESDGTIVNYRPKHTVILSLDLDHHPVDKTAEMFRTLIKNTEDMVIMNRDDRNLKKMDKTNAITFSIHDQSDFRPERIIYRPFGSEFSLKGTVFNLSLPGEYNLYNALSCIAFLSEIGIKLDAIADVLSLFKGIDRRFDIHLDDGERLVIDDYAHNPHKISSLMNAVKRLRKAICYIFQPHGFGPTRLMKEGYIEIFARNLRDSDHLMLLPIYYAGGTAIRDISSQDIADGIRAGGKSVEVVERREDVLNRIGGYKSYVIFGARDETLSDFAKEIAIGLTAPS